MSYMLMSIGDHADIANSIGFVFLAIIFWMFLGQLNLVA